MSKPNEISTRIIEVVVLVFSPLVLHVDRPPEHAAELSLTLVYGPIPRVEMESGVFS